MKLLAIASVLTIICVAESREYFRDERGKTYVIGIYGERIYEDADGNMIERTKKTRGVEINADVMTRFGWNLFQNSTANEDSPENFVVSPLGPQLLLSLIAKESQGNTLKEIIDVIGGDGNRKLGKMVKLLTSEVTDRELSIATAMFVNADYADSLKESYASEGNKSSVLIASWDFKNTKKVQEKYNEWLRRSTNGVIKSEPLSVDRDTKMILTSSMYFKGNWIFEFTPHSEPLMFKKSSFESFPVTTIKSVYKKYHYGYLNDNNGEWLSIPYNSTEALLILLPNKTKNFNQMEDFIRATPSSDISDIMDIINGRQEPNTLVNITMPRFKIESSTNLKESLKKMGVSKVFDRDAQFYPLKEDQPMQVSSATQTSSLEVNEKGSVGASVSKFAVVALSIKAPVKHVNFIVDRPFVAVVVNRLYRVPYFIAQVTDPRDY